MYEMYRNENVMKATNEFFFVFINSTVASESRQGTETCMMIHTHIPLVDISGLFSGLSKKNQKG